VPSKLSQLAPDRAVRLGDLDCTRPISRDWGFERGLPVDRYFIESFLSRHATDIKARVLAVMDNTYALRYSGDRVTRSDIIHKGSDNPYATISADLSDAAEIPSDIFDCIICTQTLRVIYDVAGAVNTLHYAAVTFLHGLAVQDTDRHKLDEADPDFEVLIGIRARRSPSEL